METDGSSEASKLLASSTIKCAVDLRICRTCMSVKDLFPLFPQMDKYQNFMRALYLSTGLHMELNDGFPQHICKKCAKLVQSFMQFRASSQLIDKKLRVLFESQNRKVAEGYGTDDFNLRDLKHERVTFELNLNKNETDEEFYCSDNKSDKSYEQPVAPENVIRDEASKVSRKKISRKLYKDFLDGEIQNGHPVKCKVCNKNYTTLNNFKAHVEKAHRDRKLLCEFCGLRFPNNQQRLRHLRARHDLARDDTFACSYCGFQALDKEQLQSHERRQHTKERPYVCDECGEAFYTRRVLKQHAFIHKSEMPYQCDFCPKKFKFRPKLNQHRNMVHFKKQKRYIFGCYICSNKFEASSNVRKHLLRMHHIPKDQQGKVLRFYRVQAQEGTFVPDDNIGQNEQQDCT